nr:hypothetical protein [uncultured Mediterranean phage uvMED]|tara:strand:+ start:2976 stop:3413 length:438 start_codon:yes stop_codon:yes gene_type:complete
MSLNYIKPDEEFYGCIKLTSGEELLGRVVVVEEHKGFYCAFIQDPGKVHSTEKMIEDKRAVAVGLKRWMVFSDEDFFIIPEERIITIAPMSSDAVLMYKFFCKQEFKKHPDDLPDSSIELTQEMGLIGEVEKMRKKLEQLFNGNS